MKFPSSKNGRIVLLHEPETSLHPDAQERLLEFLLRETNNKNLQVVVSTHSPAFIRQLPKQAIRVFSLDANNHAHGRRKRQRRRGILRIGHPTENQIELIVEDRLSKQIVDAVLSQPNDSFSSESETSVPSRRRVGIRRRTLQFICTIRVFAVSFFLTATSRKM